MGVLVLSKLYAALGPMIEFYQSLSSYRDQPHGLMDVPGYCLNLEAKRPDTAFSVFQINFYPLATPETRTPTPLSEEETHQDAGVEMKHGHIFVLTLARVDGDMIRRSNNSLAALVAPSAIRFCPEEAVQTSQSARMV